MDLKLARGTRAALSRKSGISASYISAILNRRAKAGASVSLRLARAARDLSLPDDLQSVDKWIGHGRECQVAQ